MASHTTSYRAPTPKRERLRMRAERDFAALKVGLTMGPCWHVVLTEVAPTPSGELRPIKSLNAQIRQEAWNPLWRAIHKRWPASEAWTVVEWTPKTTGVHLHAVVRNAPELTPAWANGFMERHSAGTGGRCYRVYVGPVTDVPLLLDVPLDQVREQSKDVEEKNGREALEALEALEDSEYSGNRGDRHSFEGLVVYLTKQLRDLRILEGWPPYFHLVSSSHGWEPKTHATTRAPRRTTKRSTTHTDAQPDGETHEQVAAALPVAAA